MKSKGRKREEREAKRGRNFFFFLGPPLAISLLALPLSAHSCLPLRHLFFLERSLPGATTGNSSHGGRSTSPGRDHIFVIFCQEWIGASSRDNVGGEASELDRTSK